MYAVSFCKLSYRILLSYSTAYAARLILGYVTPERKPVAVLFELFRARIGTVL